MGRMTLYIGAAIVIVAVVACAAMVLLDNDDDGARVVYDPNISLEEPVFDFGDVDRLRSVYG